MHLLHQAIKNRHRALVKQLIQQAQAPQLNQKDKQGNTPLHMAVLKLEYDFMNLLLENGADVNLQNNQGWSALHYAVVLGGTLFVKRLLAFNANPSLRNHQNMTPYDLIEDHQRSTLGKLLEHHTPKPFNRLKPVEKTLHHPLDRKALVAFKILEMRNTTPQAKHLSATFYQKMASECVYFLPWRVSK